METIPRIDAFGDRIDAGTRQARVDDALARLTQLEREIFLLAVVERIPVEEIAERTGRYPLATTLLLSRAMGQMRRDLGDSAAAPRTAPGWQ